VLFFLPSQKEDMTTPNVTEPLMLWRMRVVMKYAPPSAYSFWYSSLPSSFFDSATLRTALLKSSWLMASR
jgi:hypothetical protein